MGRDLLQAAGKTMEINIRQSECNDTDQRGRFGETAGSIYVLPSRTPRHTKLTKMLITSIVCGLIKFTHTSQRALPLDETSVVSQKKSSLIFCPTTVEKREGG